MFMAAVTPNFIGTASTAYAKTVGWTEENGNWYYYDSYGEAITDTWKKNGDDWYYLDSDGIRAADRQNFDLFFHNNDSLIFEMCVCLWPTIRCCIQWCIITDMNV